MGQSEHQSEQLSRLAAALYDGEITPPEAARLEQIVRQSPAALEQFVHYAQMHGEIAWAAGHDTGRRQVARPELPEAPPVVCAAPLARAAMPAGGPAQARPRHRRRQWIIAATTAAAMVLVSLGAAFWFLGGTGGRTPSDAAPAPLARLLRSVRAEWSGDAAVPDGADLRAGQTLGLDRGLAEIRFLSGARVILEGPARFRVESRNACHLETGSLVAAVPRVAVGFTVGTQSVTVVDRGTDLGVAADGRGASEVEVFTGRVQLEPIDAARAGKLPIEIAAGQSVRIRLGEDGEPIVTDLRPGTRHFVRKMPPLGASARLRALAAAHPELLHHYTFEGASFGDKCRDRRGKLHLSKVAMAGGAGGGDVYELAPGFDPESNALRPFRHPAGNAVGAGMQSWGGLQPLSAMTIELLLKLEKSPALTQQSVCAAVALKGHQPGGGFCVAAVEGGRLAYRLSGKSPWGVTGLTLTPGDWYYVAVALRTDAGQTTVDGFAANLSRGQATLTWLIQAERAASPPAAGQIAVGAGYDEQGQNAYPWPGILDEVAVYGAALSQQALQEHLQALVEDE